MNVIEVVIEIVVVFNRVLPIFRLPNPPASIVFSPLRDNAFSSAIRQPALSELGFDPLPSSRVICISVWHIPDRMKVIVEKDGGDDFKRVGGLTLPHDVADHGSRDSRLKYWATLICNDREEKRSARNNCSSPVWHAPIVIFARKRA